MDDHSQTRRSRPGPRPEPFRVVLVEPEIPWNTGNVGRTCLGFGAELHLVGKLGFSLDDRHLKRAGLDYWPRVRVKTHPDVGRFFDGLPKKRLFFFSSRAKKVLWDAKVPRGAFLVLGSETRGLPKSLWKSYPGRFFRIPLVKGAIRSFNLSTSSGIVLAEAVRQSRKKK